MEYPRPFLLNGRMQTYLTDEERAHFQVRVYVLVCGGFFKIGIAADIQKRIAGLQTGNPQKIELFHDLSPMPRKDARRIEQTAHRRLAEFKVHGEWFACTAEQAIAAIAGGLSL